jgi:hypothetical protein
MTIKFKLEDSKNVFDLNDTWSAKILKQCKHEYTVQFKNKKTNKKSYPTLIYITKDNIKAKCNTFSWDISYISMSLKDALQMFSKHYMMMAVAHRISCSVGQYEIMSKKLNYNFKKWG